MNPQYVYTQEAMESIYKSILHIDVCASLICCLLFILIVITLIKGK